jgi:hypothetical protein
MQTIEARLNELPADYKPKRLTKLGDLVHDGAGARELLSLVARLQTNREVILIAGNHDREIKRGGLPQTSRGSIFSGHGEATAFIFTMAVARLDRAITYRLPVIIAQRARFTMRALRTFGKVRSCNADSAWP